MNTNGTIMQRMCTRFVLRIPSCFLQMHIALFYHFENNNIYFSFLQKFTSLLGAPVVSCSRTNLTLEVAKSVDRDKL